MKLREDIRDLPRTLARVLEECRSEHVELQEERVAGAAHEAGHALLLVLGAFPIHHVHISRLSFETRKRMRELFGQWITPLTSSGMVPNIDIVLVKPELFESEITMCELAGVAAESAQPVNQRGVSHFRDSLRDIQHTKWSDVENPYKTIFSKFFDLTGRKPEHEEVVAILEKILDRLSQLFKEPKFATAISAIRDLFLEKGSITNFGEQGINEQLKELLTNSGIDEKDFASMQKAVLSIEIDDFIKEHVTLRHS